jgi:MarR family
MPTESTTGGTGLRDRADGTWTLLTGHGHVLVEIARNNRAPTRGIAAAAGLTQRTVHAIITDLEAAGYLTRKRNGRRMIYIIHPDRPFRHPAQAGLRIGPLLELLASPRSHDGDAAGP